MNKLEDSVEIRNNATLVLGESSVSSVSHQYLGPDAEQNKICKKEHHQRLANVQM